MIFYIFTSQRVYEPYERATKNSYTHKRLRPYEPKGWVVTSHGSVVYNSRCDGQRLSYSIGVGLDTNSGIGSYTHKRLRLYERYVVCAKDSYSSATAFVE